MATILLTGASGQLGTEIQELYRRGQTSCCDRVMATDVAELDIADYDRVVAMIRTKRIDAILNCAAYTAVDKAEAEPQIARRVNATGAATLARAARDTGAALVHVSTDYVFDGNRDTPYTEDDTPAPEGIYGQTKLEGEQAIRSLGCRHAIVRTAWLYSAYGANFVKTMMRLGRERGEVNVVDDQWGSPTWAADLARFIVRNLLPQLLASPVYGEVYHYSNAGRTTWCGFAGKVMELAGIPCRVNPVTTAEYPTAARRPRYSLLDKGKAIHDFGITVPGWEESLAACIHKIKEQ